jgi:trans-2-enoyl-CoA reductase
MSVVQYKRSALVYAEHGDPSKVLKLISAPQSTDVQNSEVLVRMLAAPINPADINMIQGVYPVKPKLPAVGGNEGVGEVLKVGQAVTDLQPGDWVMPGAAGWGTWRTVAVCPSNELIKIPNNLPLESAATLAVNPCTAYRMLVDFVTLSAGDCVIQNGANSGVGQAVIQIAKAMSLQTINVIRAGRPDHDQLVGYLKGLGATYVVTDEFLQTAAMRDLVSSLKNGPPRLGFNCVGGRMFADLIKYIGRKGVVVTYGGMAKQPLSVPAGPLIFNDVKLCGYWMTRWNSENRHSEAASIMWDYLGTAVRDGKLKAPLHRFVSFSNFGEAILRAMEPFVSEKQILLMNENGLKK